MHLQYDVTGIVTFNAAEREDECGLEDGGGLSIVGFVDEDDALLEVDGSVARSGRLCGTLTRTHAATAPAMSTGIVTFNAAEREDECGLEDGGGLVGFVDEDDALLEVDGSVALRVRVALVIASLCPLRLLLRSPYASRFAAGRITGRRGEGEGGMRRGQNEK